MKKLSVIIINYNTRELLQQCILNLLNSYELLEIIVVDNGSTDGSAQMVKEEFKDVVVIETQNNGLAAGSNLGLKASTGDYLLYLGTDAFPQKEMLAQMIAYMENESKVGVSTSKLVLRDGKTDMDAHRGFPTPWAALTHFSRLNKLFPKSAVFNQYFLGYKDLNTPHEIDLCISHFMLVKKQVFNDIGLWDEDFFVYGEDVDFCYRVKQAGWKIMYLPQWSAVHYKGAGVGIRKETKDIKNASSTSKETQNRMRRETTKAMKLFYEKHYTKKYPWLLRQVVYTGIDVLAKIRNSG